MTPSPNATHAEIPQIPRPRTLSPQQLEANRCNAQLSTGPRTEEGKQRTRLNARRHDLTGQVSILPDTERDAVEIFCQRIIASFAPGSGFEMQLARNIAESQWRLNRARAIEDNFFAHEIGHYPEDPMADGHPQIADALHQARAFERRSQSFDRLTLYEMRIQRALTRNLQLFHEARQQRLAAEANAFEEAQLLRQLATLKGEAFDPESEAKANNGFLFSLDRIDASLRRSRLLEEARNAPIYRPQAAPPLIRTRAA